MRKAIFGEKAKKLEKSINDFMRKIQTNGTIQVKPDNLAAFTRSAFIFAMKNETMYNKFLKDLGKDRADHIEESKKLKKAMIAKDDKARNLKDFNIS
jgi:hypothetical protein|tara:strand:- start:420 stop:710 length:291 start_codon:yes stop_codon:yes gene_type:complete